jgi:serine/threonine protein kinase
MPDRLFIGGEPLPDYVLEGEIGSGANGTVYRVRNEHIGRTEALKVWQTNRPQDQRDKVAQGIAEARKLSEARSDWVVPLYAVRVFGGHCIATMEYVDGVNLRDWLEKGQNLPRRYFVGLSYVRMMRELHFAGIYHGDPHWKNVMISEPVKIRLLDFGTSLFSPVSNLRSRHWKVVEETFEKIVGCFPSYDNVSESMRKAFPGFGCEALLLAYMDDVLDGVQLDYRSDMQRAY